MAERRGRPEKRRTGDEEDTETGGRPGERLRSQGNLAPPPERQTSETSVEVEVTQETIEVDKATYITIQQLRAQLEQATQWNRIQQLQLQQLQQQANAANVEQTNEVEQSPASERLPQRSEPQLEPRTPSPVQPIQASHPSGSIPVQPQQILEGSTVDDEGNMRAVHPQYDSKLVAPQGLTEPEYEIAANLFGQLVSAYHHNADRRKEISVLLANYQTNGPESLRDIPDCVDVRAPHFESFRHGLVHLSESHLTRKDQVVERVLQGLCATDRNLNFAPGCLRGLVQFESAGGFGYFLASYSKGKLSKMLKSVIFDKSFYAKFVCPDMIGGKQMLEVDRRQAEQLLRFLLDRLLRVQVLLDNSDIKKCLSESKLEVPIQISVARLFIPKAEADEKAQQLFNESFQSNIDVKAAFLLSSSSATTAILQPTGENIPDRNQTPSFSVMAKPLQMDEMAAAKKAIAVKCRLEREDDPNFMSSEMLDKRKEEMLRQSLGRITEVKCRVEGEDDPNVISSEMLDERKEVILRQSLGRIAEERKKKLPTKVVYLNKSGKIGITGLIYNTKHEFAMPYECKYKTAVCKHTACLNGECCKYAHGEEEMKIWNEVQIHLERWFDTAKMSTLDHYELCQNQACPLRLRLLLRKTLICKFWEEGNCTKGASCSYAHGYSELKPLPKYELCTKFARNLCPLESSECVYAHQQKELRKEGAKTITDDELSGLTEGFADCSRESAAVSQPMASVVPEQLCDICEELQNSLPPQARDRYVVIARDRDVVIARDQDVVTAGDQDVVTARHQDVVTARHQDVVTARHQDVVTARHQDVVTARHQDVVTARHQDVVTAGDQDVVTARPGKDMRNNVQTTGTWEFGVYRGTDCSKPDYIMLPVMV